ncbi:MAG: hypothetical protein K6B14_07785 [Lachnospiraceae bacterium]|nr:hypothetical protein [Lachnospiraceae bacterium]
MKRLVIVLIFAFIISGGTVGILYQEGFGGVKKSDKETVLATEEDIAAAQAESADIAASYDSNTDDPYANIGDSSISESTATEEDVDTADADVVESEVAEEEVAEEPEATEEAATEEPAATETAEEETGEDSEAAAAAKAEKEEKGPFYSVTVLGINGGGLTMHKNANGQGDSLGTVNKGVTGYMIGNHSAGTRRLCYIDGKICYLSKNYTEVTEIDADEYPDALLSVTESDSGSDFSIE